MLIYVQRHVHIILGLFDKVIHFYYESNIKNNSQVKIYIYFFYINFHRN